MLSKSNMHVWINKKKKREKVKIREDYRAWGA
jgi:hypothetical protein